MEHCWVSTQVTGAITRSRLGDLVARHRPGWAENLTPECAEYDSQSRRTGMRSGPGDSLIGWRQWVRLSSLVRSMTVETSR